MMLVSLFLYICLMKEASSISLLELEIQYNGVKAILEREQNTTRQLKLEISELRKERVTCQTKSCSTDDLSELKERLDLFSSNLDSLKSSLEIEKTVRYDMRVDLGQVKQWTKDQLTKTELDCEKKIANFTKSNRDEQLDYNEFKALLSKEWDLYKNQSSTIVNGIESEFDQVKVVIRRQQNQTESRLEVLASSVKYLMECDSGWVRNGCFCYMKNDERLSFDADIIHCKGLGARLIQPHEISKVKTDIVQVWLGVRRDDGQSWKYTNGTEAAFQPTRPNPTPGYNCGAVTTNILTRTYPCSVLLNSVCVKI